MLLIAIFVLSAYLIGSLSTAIITCRLLGLPDPRSQGSGNPGATNVLRFGGKKAAAATLLGDFLKGLLPGAFGLYWGLPPAVIAGIGLAAVLGHIFPVYFQFKGGKGVATGLGAVLAVSWAAGVCAAITWFVMAKIFKISSLSALVATALTPIFALVFDTPTEAVAILAFICGTVILRHRDNIQRLLAGKETKIGR